MDTDLDSQPIEKNVGDHNVCLICMRNRLAKRMRDIYGADCIHDRYWLGSCLTLDNFLYLTATYVTSASDCTSK